MPILIAVAALLLPLAAGVLVVVLEHPANANAATDITAATFIRRTRISFSEYTRKREPFVTLPVTLRPRPLAHRAVSVPLPSAIIQGRCATAAAANSPAP